MGKPIIIAGIDIGSNNICCVVGMYNSESGLVKIIDAIRKQCDGIKAGSITNIQEAALCMKGIIEKLEKSLDEPIKNIVIGIRGNFIISRHSKGIVNMDHVNKEITFDTIESVLENARKQIRVDPEQEILQIVPIEYILNQQRGIHNPVGMEGTYIEVSVCAFVAPSNSMKNLTKVLKSLDIENDIRVYGYLTTSDMLVTKEEKELSCLVIDFGGLTTGLIHYTNGMLSNADEILDGSDYITKDIGHKLRTTYSLSKEIKETYGAAFIHDNFEDKEFEYKIADGKSIKKCSRFELVNGVIMPRVDRIMYKIKELIERNDYGDDFLSGGIILTGGGAKLPGITEAFEKVFNCPVRLGFVNFNKLVGLSDISFDSSYTTAIGAIMYGFSNFNHFNTSKKLQKKVFKKNIFFRISKKISKWAEEIF
ncbi:MAG: cell division protein FtsA [Endomicrobium sp.]|jgi:cell division protein FtsA|nr:cell division protein FtsA [Endomicrobium sp.]